ncbi:MAG: FG-GAP-like repeat-containing protein [Gammaproteobacteria bacterium]
MTYKDSRRFTRARERLLLGLTGLALSVSVFAEPVFDERTTNHLDLAGVSVSDTRVKKLALGDVNNDGIEDIVVARRGDVPRLFLNLNGVLTNSAALFGGTGLGSNSYDVEIVDVNSDGWSDLFFGRVDERPALYLNNGDDGNGNWLGFDGGTTVSVASSRVTMVESADLDGDEDMDFILLRSNGSRNYLVNNGSGVFTNETTGRLGSNVLDSVGKIQLADIENDGDVDIIGIAGSENVQSIFYNDGNGNFPNSGIQNLDLDNLTYMPVGADFNGDNMIDMRVYADNFSPTAFISEGTMTGGFVDYLKRLDPDMIGDNGKHGFAFIRDLDNDGDPDYIMSSIEMLGTGLNPDPRNELNEMVITTGNFSGNFDVFADPEWRVEESYDVVITDVNIDGNQDLVFAHEGRYAIYINDAAPAIVEFSGIVPVTLEAGVAGTMEVTVTGGVAPEFSWSISDGGKEFTGTDPTLEYTFAEPGRYQVTVTLTDTVGSDQFIFFQNVHAPLSATKPVSSSTILYQERAGADDLVWTVNTDNDSVTAINVPNKLFLQEISVGDNPTRIAQIDVNTLWAINRDSHSISEINTNTFAVSTVMSFDYGASPHSIVVNSDGTAAYVSLLAEQRVVKINLALNQIDSSLALDFRPRDLALNADGSELYVSRFITAPVPGESTRNVTTGGGGEVARVDTGGMTVLNTMVLAYNDEIDTQDSSRGVPNYVMGAALSPDATVGVVPSNISNIYRGSFRDGNPREHDRLVRSLLARLDMTAQQELVEERFDFDDNSQPTAALFGPNGNHLYVVHEGSRSIHVLDVYANQIIVTRTAGTAPRGIALSPDGELLYVHNYLDRTVGVYDASNLMQGIENSISLDAEVATVVAETLNPFVLTGKKLFFDAFDSRLSSQAYISCATCHDDAGHDGRTWDFSDGGEGLRNTIDLRGRGGIAHGNVHWTANFDEIHDFENDIRGVFDGTGLLSNADFALTSDTLGVPKSGLNVDLDALAGYTATLNSVGDSPNRASNGNLTTDGQAGQALFASSNCSRCHANSEFTDSPLGGFFHNVGTVDADTGGRLGTPLVDGGLDTPTLRGLWHGAPYLHDGSAATVQQAILAHTNEATVGIDVTSLGASDLDNLASYLLQIDDSEPAASAPNGNFPPYVLNPGTQQNNVGDVVNVAVTARDNNSGAISYVADGLPAGLSINANTGVISGATAGLGGTYTVTLTATTGSSGLQTSVSFEWLTVGDNDSDGITDTLDNCQLDANADQRDSNGDGIGNVCDFDFSNDCIVNFVDLAILTGDFLSTGDLDTDINGDGVVNFIDIAPFQSRFLNPPGPSALNTSCGT